MKFYIDLEGTIIESWDKPKIINREKIKSFHRKFWYDCDVNIFSFAIWTARDSEHFERHLKSTLESVLERPIISYPTVEEMNAAIFKPQGIKLSTVEVISIWGKSRTFIDWCKIQHPREDCVLIDDVVEMETLHNFERDQVIYTVNIDKIENTLG